MSRASAMPKRSVPTTPASSSAIMPQPSDSSISTLIRAPSTATPKRSTVRAVKATPGAVGPSSPRKLSAMPKSSAISIEGAP